MILTKEIIRRFLFDIGVIPEHFGKYGITLSDFKLEEKFFVHYDNGDEVGLSLWAGEGNLSETKIRALLLDLRQNEYALALRVDDNPIYLLRLAEEEDEGNFLIQDGNDWVVPKLLIQLRALIGMETIVDQGMIWFPSSYYEDLLQALTKIVEL
jgi:hypothetical protein